MAIRLGELLVEGGHLSREQVDAILEQQRLGGRPFGDLAERMFGIDPSVVESAWARQFSELCEEVDPCALEIDPGVLEVFSRRQAWQFRLLPIRRENGELVVATSRTNLPRAMRFTSWHLQESAIFVICSGEQLERALERNYPFPGALAPTPAQGL